MFRRFSSVLVLALLFPGTSRSNPARDDLLRFVPEDVAFCMVVQNLRGQVADAQASGLIQKWGKTFLGSEAGIERKQLAQFEKYLEKYLGVTWKDLHDDILGDAFAFAYRPGPPNKPGDEQGLFLTHARDAKKLARLVDSLNKLQKSTGELEALTDHQYRGIPYVARREAKKTTYYLLRGQVFLFTGQEALLKRAMDCDRALAAKTKPPLTRRMEELHLDKAFVALAINPRAWDEVITGKAADEATRAVAQYWKAVDSVGIGVYLDRDLRLALTIKARADRLPPALRRFLAASNKPSTLWSSFPDDALFAMSNRLDLAALYEATSEFVPRASRKALEDKWQRTIGAVLGKNVVKDLLPALGPDWGMCITAPSRDSKQWVPHAVLAVRVDRGDDNDPVDQALLSAVRTWAQLLVLGHNTQHPAQTMSLKTTLREKVRIRYLSGENVFPPEIEPAFALKAGYLVAASSPAEIVRFKPTATVETGSDIPLLRVSLKHWRNYLADRAEPLADLLARTNGMTKAKALARLEAIRAGLERIDRVELRQRVQGDVVSFTLSVTAAVAKKER